MHRLVKEWRRILAAAVFSVSISSPSFAGGGLLGIDHKRLTYYYNGRNMRLTDVAGELIPQIVG